MARGVEGTEEYEYDADDLDDEERTQLPSEDEADCLLADSAAADDSTSKRGGGGGGECSGRGGR